MAADGFGVGGCVRGPVGGVLFAGLVPVLIEDFDGPGDDVGDAAGFGVVVGYLLEGVDVLVQFGEFG